MILVHRLTHPDEPTWLNPDLIQQLDMTPDTVVTLTNGHRYVVGETPEQIIARVREWRAGVVSLAAATPEPMNSVVRLPITETSPPTRATA